MTIITTTEKVKPSPIQENINSANKTKQKAPACISAISRKTWKTNGVQDCYDGEYINIFPGYTEFRPQEYEMNVLKKEFKEFVESEEKTTSQLSKKHSLHRQYKENRYDFPEFPIIDVHYKIINKNIYLTAKGLTHFSKFTDLQKSQYAAMVVSESRLYIKSKNITCIVSKRGLITCVSAKSANNLKKTMARCLSLDLWIDLTFADDVFKGMTFQERLTYCTNCLYEFERYIRSLNIHYIWKKELQDRKSGPLMGCRVPHYHVVLCYLSENQKNNYENLAIQLLSKWVNITRTKDEKAMIVALCKKDGIFKSFRRITSSKMAGAYIGKYFSKTENLPGYLPMSIGRAWGKDSQIPLSDGLKLNLTREESILIRRIVRKACKLRQNRKFIGVGEQLKRGYSTFLFLSESFILRLINRYVSDPWKQADPIPF